MRIFLIVTLLLIGACGDNYETRDYSEAYSDGFEVVVVEKDGAISSLHLRDAERRIENGATYIIKTDKIEAAIEALEEKYTRGSMPKNLFINLDVQQTSENTQNIRLSFHYSKSTYFYEYSATGTSIQPIESGYNDLSVKKKAIYK